MESNNLLTLQQIIMPMVQAITVHLNSVLLQLGP